MSEPISCRYCMLIGLAAAFAAVCVVLAVLFVTMPGRARAESPQQKWIHENAQGCCDHRDCFPAVVTYTPYGWRVDGASHLVRRVIPWPFGEPYACWSGFRVRCLLMESKT